MTATMSPSAQMSALRGLTGTNTTSQSCTAVRRGLAVAPTDIEDHVLIAPGLLAHLRSHHAVIRKPHAGGGWRASGFRPQRNRGLGRGLLIAVHQQHIPAGAAAGQRQLDGQRALAGSTFCATNGNNHNAMPLQSLGHDSQLK
jgi:hypothetical protein